MSAGFIVRRISIKGVVIGSIIDVLGSSLFSAIATIIVLAQPFARNLPKERMEQLFLNTRHSDVPLFLLTFLVGVFFSVLGGYISARIARHDELLNGALSAILCDASGVYSLATGSGTYGVGTHLLLLAVCPILGLIGGFLRIAEQNRRARGSS